MADKAGDGNAGMIREPLVLRPCIHMVHATGRARLATATRLG
ncbi:hypothetical protein [Laribacter hongkongensis]|nr:hypothetical protein [Laribacter hongkongensis]